MAKSSFEDYYGGPWQEDLIEAGWNPQLHTHKASGHDQFSMTYNEPESAKELMVWPVPSAAMSKSVELFVVGIGRFRNVSDSILIHVVVDDTFKQ